MEEDRRRMEEATIGIEKFKIIDWAIQPLRKDQKTKCFNYEKSDWKQCILMAEHISARI